MALQSICPTLVLENPKADYQSAVRVGQYRMSSQALYFAAFPFSKYLPYGAIQRAWCQKSSLPLTGCCGKELPVVVLRVKYEGGFYQNFTFERQSEADRVLTLLRQCRPDVPQEPEPNP